MMPLMRTTVRIDDDLLKRLKEQAHRDDVRLTDLINRLIRRGLEATWQRRPTSSKAYRERVVSLGQATANPTKALALAAALEDEETLDELARRK
jgi:predicted DNA-binding ribbon-helix-helix protein